MTGSGSWTLQETDMKQKSANAAKDQRPNSRHENKLKNFKKKDLEN
jgi:hypothetical protein